MGPYKNKQETKQTDTYEWRNKREEVKEGGRIEKESILRTANDEITKDMEQ